MTKEEITAAKNLRLIIDRWKMTYPQFAALVNEDKINPGSLGSVLRNITRPTVLLIKRLKELTGISMYDLYVTEIKEERIPKKPIESKNDSEAIPEGPTHLTQDLPLTLVQANWRSMKMEEYFAQMDVLKQELIAVKNKVAALEEGAK